MERYISIPPIPIAPYVFKSDLSWAPINRSVVKIINIRLAIKQYKAFLE
jgi:hypothetical protein